MVKKITNNDLNEAKKVQQLLIFPQYGADRARC